jgi:LmbE family N-acetylglucosaminyl deacetylase
MSLINWKRVLVLGAHIDDETIGPGGTIAALSEQGSHITVVTFTGGDTDTGYTKPEMKGQIGQIRRDEARKIDQILGIHQRIFLGYPLQDVPNNVDAYQECVRIIRQVRPDVIFTHWEEDKHRDHRAIAVLTDEARWKAAGNIQTDLGTPWYTPELLFYEIMELFPHPSILVDITDTLDRKLEAMKATTSQLDVLPGVMDYMRGLAMARGYGRGSKYAEAFLRSNLLPTRY